MREYSFDYVVHPNVYAPSDDTYLLIEAVELESDDIFVEMGCGTGLVSLTAARTARTVISADISIEALKNTKENILKTSLSNKCHIFQTDLMSVFAPTFQVSVIAFNPPYLPQDDESVELDHALIGGEQGVELSERFLHQVVNHLLPSGSVYLVASSLGDIDRLKDVTRSVGFEVTEAASKRLFYEELVVLKGTLQGPTATVL
ncbi:MAG: methyltransferase [Candidatus Thorarchaeota archaeon]